MQSAIVELRARDTQLARDSPAGKGHVSKSNCRAAPLHRTQPTHERVTVLQKRQINRFEHHAHGQKHRKQRKGVQAKNGKAIVMDDDGSASASGGASTNSGSRPCADHLYTVHRGGPAMSYSMAVSSSPARPARAFAMGFVRKNSYDDH